MDPIQFDAVQSHSEIYGLYTYENGVFVFRDSMDIDFDELTEKEKEHVISLVESKKWTINPALQ